MIQRKTVFVACLVLAASAASVWAGEKSRFGTDVSEWSSDTPASPTEIPIGGSGQVNGDFVVGERNGVQIGMRASRRFLQNVSPLANSRDKKVAVYLADTGVSDAQGRATWNYDLHVDLRGAKGVAKGKSLGDYTLTLDSDIGPSLFGADFPVDLGAWRPDATVLWQESWNPKFGNPPFDALAPGTYHFTLTLEPKTFRGPPIAVSMRVEVSE